MSEIQYIFSLIPDYAYKYILMGLAMVLFFKKRIPILNKVDVKFHFSEDFMRSFRWITPAVGFSNLIVQVMGIFLIFKILNIVREVLLILKQGG